MSSTISDLPDYVSVPRSPLGPAVNDQATTSGELSGIFTGSPTATTSRHSAVYLFFDKLP